MIEYKFIDDRTKTQNKQLIERGLKRIESIKRTFTLKDKMKENKRKQKIMSRLNALQESIMNL